jgi:glycosyltransferase involved in cell wall biosynthesis
MPMRVLHVIPTIALEHGGPSHAVRIMARAVAEVGAEVDVVATSQGTPQGKEDPRRAWVYEEGGVTYRLFPQRAGSRWNFSLPLTRWLFGNVHRYDVLHVHSPFVYPTLSACLAARRANVPYLYRTLGILDPWSLRQKAWKKWPYYHLIERRNLLRSCVVHVTSEAERQAIIALGVTREKIALIPVGIPSVRRRTAPLAEWPFRVLFIGRLHPKKGIPLLIDAIKQLRTEGTDAVLDIAGTGEPRYVDSLASHVRGLALDDVIRFVGFAAGERKAELFARAHVMALPSYDENFGISVAEAMAYGLPVVISDAVAIADHVRAAGAGRVCRTGDVPTLTQALRELLSDDARDACGERGAALVASEFSVAVMAQRLMSEYRRAIGVTANDPALAAS